MKRLLLLLLALPVLALAAPPGAINNFKLTLGPSNGIIAYNSTNNALENVTLSGATLTGTTSLTLTATGSGVTSVSGSGGTTGLTLTGGPITTTGTLTLGGTLAVANGGTGTASPGLVAGTNVTITGSWPNQTVNSTSGGSVPTGTGFVHITSGAQDAAARAVNLSNTDATGALAAGRFPALTGDVTTSAGSLTTTLANIPSAVPAAGSILFTNIAAPASPSAGTVSIFADSTDLRFHDKNESGVVGTTVVSDTGSSNNFLTGISASGVISKAQPTEANLSLSAITTNNANNTRHGFMPATPANANLYANGGSTPGYSTVQFSQLGGLIDPSQQNSAVNAQTGTTYTVVDGDRGKLVTLSNASPVAVTLPQAGASSSFVAGWFAYFESRGAGLVTITPTTSTIDGAATITLIQNSSIRVFSDGTNYFTIRGKANLPAVTLAANNFATAMAADGTLSGAQPSDANLSVTDVTTNNVSTSAHGFAPKGDGNAAHYLDGTGAYSTPSQGWTFVMLASDVTTTSLTLVDSGIAFTPVANKTYAIQGHIVTQKNSGTGGTKFAIAGPASPGLISIRAQGSTATSTTVNSDYFNAFGTASVAYNTVAATDGWWEIMNGIIVNGANTTDIKLQFEAVGSQTSKIYAGSYIAYKQLN